MSDTWNKEFCQDEKCKATNWVCLGDMQDLTVPDVEAFECYKCGKLNLLDPDSLPDLLRQYLNFDVGLEAPR